MRRSFIAYAAHRLKRVYVRQDKDKEGNVTVNKKVNTFSQAVQRAKDSAQQPDSAGGGYAVPLRCEEVGREGPRGTPSRRLPPPRAQRPPPASTPLRLLSPGGTLVKSRSRSTAISHSEVFLSYIQYQSQFDAIDPRLLQDKRKF